MVGKTSRSDNYQELCRQWQERYLSMDRNELKARFNLRADDHAHYITYYQDEYRLDQQDGSLTLVSDPNRVISFNTTMAIYTLFHYSKPEAKVCGEFVPFREVKRAAPFAPAFQRMIVDPFCKSFSGQIGLLKSACEALHGQPIPQGDIGAVFHAFDWMPVRLAFWDGDDEFDAQATILFDANITDFLHEESVVCIGADLVRRLCEEAGLPISKDLLGSTLSGQKPH